MAHQNREPPAITVDRPDAPKDLLAICRKMMVKDRDQRYSTALDVEQARRSGSSIAARCVRPAERFSKTQIGLCRRGHADVARRESSGRSSAAGSTHRAEGKVAR